MTLPSVRSFHDTPLGRAVPFWLLALMVFAVPLFVWYPAQDPFILSKRSLLEALVWLMGGCCLWRAAAREPIRILFHPSICFLILWLLWQMASVLWAASPTMAWDQVRETAHLVAFAILFQTILQGDRRRLLALGWLLVISSTVVATWTIAVDFLAAFSPERVAVKSVLGDWRDAVSTASFGNTGHIADFITCGFLVTLAQCLTARGRTAPIFCMVALWLQAAALIVCWSVHSNASLLIAASLWVFWIRDWRSELRLKRHIRRLLPLAAGWLLVILFYVVDHPANPHGSSAATRTPGAQVVHGGIFTQAFSSGRWKEGGPTRIVIWLTTLEIVREQPWLGAGAGNFTWIYPAVRSQIVENDPELMQYAGAWTNAAHNDLLQTWSETGILGAFILIVLVGSAFQSLNRWRINSGFGNSLIASTTMAMLTAQCLQSQMNFLLELPVSSYLFVALICVPSVLPQRGREQDLMLPAERDFGPLTATIVLKNMRVPVEAGFSLNVSRTVAGILGLTFVAGGLWYSWLHLAPIRASALYRLVYEARRSGAPQNPQALVARCRTALRINPRYVDCRSALTELLIQSGRYSDAVAESTEVIKRLNATEAHGRLAVSLDALGREEEALQSWDVVFTRRPEIGSSAPEAYARWQAQKADSAQNSPKPD